MNRSPKTVVFDFDHTLYDGDSGQHLVAWLLRRSRWRTLLALALAPVFAPMVAHLPSRRCGLSAFVWAGTLGIDPQHGLTPLVHAYLAEHAGTLRARLLPTALGVLQQHLDAGDYVVIATGAPPLLAQGILALAGYGALPVLGTEVGAHLGGYTIRRHCHFSEKMRMLHEAGVVEIDIAYSDSSADLPLLKAARQPVSSAPCPKARRFSTGAARSAPGAFNPRHHPHRAAHATRPAPELRCQSCHVRAAYARQSLPARVRAGQTAGARCGCAAMSP